MHGIIVAAHALLTCRRMKRLLPLLLILAACGKKADVPDSVTAADLAGAPILPSPRAGTYARVIQTPRDPVVRAVVADRAWDASLAGTAAGLALGVVQDGGGYTRRELREAAWQAGYPWPILSLGAWPTNEAGAPPRDVALWVRDQPADRDVGVVRARGRGQDLWVALAGKPPVDLGVIPRAFTQGQPLRLPAHPGGMWRISDGSGALREGDLTEPVVLPLDSPGEWLIHLYDDGGDLARFPVYVDEDVPRAPILPPRNKAIGDANAARARFIALLQRARDGYGNGPFNLDPLLERAAQVAHDEGTDPLERARSLAPGERGAVGFTCTATAVEDCVDQVLWDPRHRRAFLDPGDWNAGVSVRWAADKVEVLGVLVQ